jgi:Zn-dependent peptidase ImmA (M78 family)
VEEEAYAIGAAALVPFSGLRQLMPRYPTIQSLADHFVVSRSLIRYRLTVLQLIRFLPSL